MFSDKKIIGTLFILLVLFLGTVFAASGCFVNGQPVECPQFLNDYGIYIVIGFFVLIIVIFAVVGFFFLKAFMTGSVTPVLSKTFYTQGETIQGQMKIKLKKPITVQSGTVTLLGERKTTSYSRGKSTTRTDVIFSTSNNIVLPPSYSIGEAQVDFQIMVPQNVLNAGKLDVSSLGGVGQAINFLQNVVVPKTNWYVQTQLKTSENIVLSGRTRIDIN